MLLNLIPGVSRTVLAMARRSELPAWFSHIHPTRSLPLRAELTLASVVIGLVWVVDLRGAIGLSGVAVLTYYAITNAAALTLSPDERRWPPFIAGTGLIGCLVLVLALPLNAVLAGAGVLLAGVIVRRVM